MLLELGLAVGGGLLNAINGSEEDRQMEKRKQQAIALLKENIIDPNELDTMLQNVNRLFNNRLATTLNSTALRSRGIANSNVAKGVVAGGIEASRLGALTDVNMKVIDSNKQTREKMASVDASMGPQHNFFGDFAGGALAAAPVGIELSKMLADPTVVTGEQPLANKVNGVKLEDLGKWMDGSQDNNPFMGSLKIKDEDLTNFGYGKFWNKKPWEN